MDPIIICIIPLPTKSIANDSDHSFFLEKYSIQYPHVYRRFNLHKKTEENKIDACFPLYSGTFHLKTHIHTHFGTALGEVRGENRKESQWLPLFPTKINRHLSFLHIKFSHDILFK